MVTPPTIEVASLGMWDTLILMGLALVVFGPRRLPEIGRQIGKLMYEVRKASNDFKFQMEEELRKSEDADRRKKDSERMGALALPTQTAGTDSVSQVSEARPGAPAPVPDGQFPTPSPYPDEAIYPPVIAAAPEAPADESYPHIQPPSTGEQVVAEPPSRSSEQGEVPVEAHSDENTPVTEQAPHG